MSGVFTVNSISLPVLGFELRTLDKDSLIGSLWNGRVMVDYEETSGDAFCADIFSSVKNTEMIATLRGNMYAVGDEDRQKYSELPASVKYLYKVSLDCMDIGNGRALSILNSLRTLVQYAMAPSGKTLEEDEFALIVSASPDTMLTLYENVVIFKDMLKVDISIVSKNGIDVLIIK